MVIISYLNDGGRAEDQLAQVHEASAKVCEHVVAVVNLDKRNVIIQAQRITQI